MSSAPGLAIEAAEAVRRGWANSGICPDPATHFTGYHMPNPKPGDYSLRGSRNVPVGSYCCAWDMRTTLPGARRYVRSLFDRVAAGVIEPTRAELIGSWDGTNVWYWAWDRGRRIERYRGQGHDNWIHQGLFRSLARSTLGWVKAYDVNGNWLEDDVRLSDSMADYQGYGTVGDNLASTLNYSRAAANVTAANAKVLAIVSIQVAGMVAMDNVQNEALAAAQSDLDQALADLDAIQAELESPDPT